MRVTGLRPGRNYLRLKSEKANTSVKLTFYVNGKVDHTETVTINEANKYQKFTLSDGYKMKKGTDLDIEGSCVEGNKTYTTNPWEMPID